MPAAKLLLAALAFWLLAPAPKGSAADWPQWRGPHRDGVWTEPGIASAFPATGLIPSWKVPVGLGYSSPILVDGKLYLSDLVAEKPVIHERVLCFNARSGNQVWATQHDATPPDWFFMPEQTRGPGSTPIVHRGRVYALSMFSTLHCLDARNGKVIWKHDLQTEYQLPPSSLDGSSLFLFTDQGDLVRAELTPGGYRELGRAHVIEPTSLLFDSKFAWSSPSFVNRHLYVRNDRELRCYSLAARSPSRGSK